MSQGTGDSPGLPCATRSTRLSRCQMAEAFQNHKLPILGLEGGTARGGKLRLHAPCHLWQHCQQGAEVGCNMKWQKSTTQSPTLGPVTPQVLLHQDARARPGTPKLLRAAGGGLTISRYSGVHRGFLSLSFCGCFQLLFQPADITVCLGLHNAQLCVDVFVLVAGVFLILAKEQEEPKSVRQTPGAEGNAPTSSLAQAAGR